MKIYYAHSRLIYGSPLENYNILAIRRILAHEPVIEIINPSELDQAIHTDTIMKRCLALVEDCDMLVFSTIDLNIGLGMYREIEHAELCDKDIYLLWENRLWWTDRWSISLNPYDKLFYASIRLPTFSQ